MFKNTFSVAIVVLVAALSFQLHAEKWKMPNGQIYEDPVVMAHNPLGLQIGFKHGVVFWKFKDLPEWLRKEYHYSKKKAERYEHYLHKRKEELMKQKIARTAKNEKLSVEEFAAEVESYKQKINDTERQIKHYQEQMAKLRAEYGKDQDRVTNLAEKALESNNNNSNNNNNSYWGWGMWSNSGNSANQRDALIGDHVTRQFENQAKDDRFKLRGLRNGLYQLQRDLPAMKTTYKHMEARLAKMRKELKEHSKDLATKTVKTRAARIDDYEKAITKLTELHRQGIITDAEYKAKRNEIINEM